MSLYDEGRGHRGGGRKMREKEARDRERRGGAERGRGNYSPMAHSKIGPDRKIMCNNINF